MSKLNYADLKPLLAQFTGEGIMLSCYADLGVADGFRPNWQAAFQSDADALAKMTPEEGEGRKELKKNAAILRRELENSQESRWLAAFSAPSRGFLQSFTLDAPVSSGLVRANSPYLVPLLESIFRRRDYLVIHTNTHRGRLYAATMAGVELLDEIDEEMPKTQRSSGECWGQAQATMVRHREDRILRYRKELLRKIEHEWDRD